MRPDKKKVVDEVWDHDRVASFLSKAPPSGENPDFFALLTAYQSMRIDDFERFLALFVAAGRDLDAVGSGGQTLGEIAGQHRHGGPFVDAIAGVRA